jgi:hypothetical protein
MPSETEEKNAAFRRRLHEDGAAVGVFSPDQYKGRHDIKIADLRRMRVQGVEDPRVAFTLTDSDGVLRWEQGYGFAAPSRRRAFRSGPLVNARIIAPVNFERLGESEIGDFLEKVDQKLTPRCDLKSPENGLRQLRDGVWGVEPVHPSATGRILLFIHGTFSNVDAYLSELKKTPEGVQFLADVERSYDQVLGFDHATVAVSPVLNAMDLAQMFKDSVADLDIIAHSRGGLVTRWWLEQFDSRGNAKVQAVLVGSPLDGTSLAAPDRLKSGLDMLTNIAHALELGGELASSTFPFLTVVTALLRVISSVTSLATKTPIMDAAVAMIPGLAAQSQIQNNNELGRLNRISSRKLDYFGVRASFMTDKPGWKFWRYFVNFGDRVKEAGASLVFETENDLVVNTPSMAVLARQPHESLIPTDRILDFGITDSVYHTVYFRQKQTVEFIRKSLKTTFEPSPGSKQSKKRRAIG